MSNPAAPVEPLEGVLHRGALEALESFEYAHRVRAATALARAHSRRASRAAQTGFQMSVKPSGSRSCPSSVRSRSAIQPGRFVDPSRAAAQASQECLQQTRLMPSCEGRSGTHIAPVNRLHECRQIGAFIHQDQKEGAGAHGADPSATTAANAVLGLQARRPARLLQRTAAGPCAGLPPGRSRTRRTRSVPRRTAPRTSR